MKVRSVLVAGLILCGVASASDDLFDVKVTVTRDDKLLGRFDVATPQDGKTVVTSQNGIRLEFETAKSAKAPVQLTVRLLDVSGGAAVQLHTARSPDAAGTPRSYAYTICNGRTTFSSPAPAELPTCESLAAARGAK